MGHKHTGTFAAEKQAHSAKALYRQVAQHLTGAILPLICLLLWQGTVDAGWINAHVLPPPSELYETLIEQFQHGALWQHILVSSLRVLLGFFIGAGLAILIGVAVGLSRQIEAFIDPSFQALRAIPSLAWVPLLLLWLGIDEPPKITLIAIGAFFPVYLNVISGIKHVDRKLVEVGEIYGLTRYRLVTRIFIPASLPSLFTGLRTGLSLAWMFLVAAELIAATKGLGYLLTDGRETGRADLVMIAIIILAVLGKISDGGLQWLERRSLQWCDVYKAEGG
ncbi:ABC transporter permease [Undibacterium sp. MH2W]|uniref:ABC transporter permease n=1 Tax=Undibacterium sp. MH2W TaxID=3413044 RepID=UPI003BF047B2